jgi:NADH:ubiquinone oxidoreductase subunit 4 (subunit M)
MNEKLVLGALVIGIIVIGVYPQFLLNLTNGFVDNILKEASAVGFIKR